jgi:tetratricopeptide (TPR) repeat protein
MGLIPYPSIRLVLKRGLIWGLLGVVLWLGNLPSAWAESVPPTAEQLQQVDQLYQKAFAATNQGDFSTAETYWTEILDQFPENPAVWSNRGNAKVSQHKLEAAIADYDKSIQLAPDQPDAYLNRGTALEGLGKWQAAIADYNQVLKLDPQDAAAYNNRGNAEAGLADWSAALKDYQQASQLENNYAFARANYALALYQTGDTQKSTRLMRNLVRKYPQFADMRAALAAALWELGKRGEAESYWAAVLGLDARYKDLTWVKETRRWPPAMVSALDKFLSLQG